MITYTIVREIAVNNYVYMLRLVYKTGHLTNCRL